MSPCRMLAIALLWITGCGLLAPRPVGVTPGAASPAGADASQAGAACPSGPFDPAAPQPDQIQYLLCHRELVDSGAAKLHAWFDDRRMPPVATAILVSLAAKDDAHGARPAEVGVASWYAEQLDAGALRGALEGVALSPAERAEFARLAETSRAKLLAEAAQLSPADRHRYVEITARVHEERAAYFERWRALYAQLDPLQDRFAALAADPHPHADAELSASLAQLRVAYLAACREPACIRQPLPGRIADDLMWLASFAGDGEGAAIEAGMIAPEATFAARVRAAIAASGPGSLPWGVDVDRDELARPKGLPTAWSGQHKVVEGIVQTVVPAGAGMAEVMFRPRSVVLEDVEDRNVKVYVPGETPGHGTIENRTALVHTGTERGTRQEPPIYLPAAEVASLTPGATLTAFVHGAHRDGRVIRARMHDRLVQLRELPVR